jgi:hypothetical protein
LLPLSPLRLPNSRVTFSLPPSLPPSLQHLCSLVPSLDSKAPRQSTWNPTWHRDSSQGA